MTKLINAYAEALRNIGWPEPLVEMQIETLEIFREWLKEAGMYNPVSFLKLIAFRDELKAFVRWLEEQGHDEDAVDYILSVVLDFLYFVKVDVYKLTGPLGRLGDQLETMFKVIEILERKEEKGKEEKESG